MQQHYPPAICFCLLFLFKFAKARPEQNGLLQIMVAEAACRRRGVACEALNMFMAYTIKHLVSTLPVELAQSVSFAAALLLLVLQPSYSLDHPHCGTACQSKSQAPLLATLVCIEVVPCEWSCSATHLGSNFSWWHLVCDSLLLTHVTGQQTPVWTHVLPCCTAQQQGRAPTQTGI